MFCASKVIIADDHPLFRTALRQALTQTFDGIEIIEADDLSALESAATVHHSDADLLLLDLHMPDTTGFSALVMMRQQYPDLPVVVVSASEENTVMQRSIDYGASGFIPKSAPLPTIAEALQSILAGNIWLPETYTPDSGVSDEERNFAGRVKSLTPQQLRVLLMLNRGLLNKQIADEISVSEATIRTHMTAIFKKLGVRNRTQAVLAAQYLNTEAQSMK